ncbi:MAG: hypothetical protein JSR79_12075 [Proteobacteria bacterium]|nr:hypothetical protein [Pseudomonadota bacterium]
MNRPSGSNTPAAGGFLIAIGLTMGAVLGMTRGNAMLWLLAGAAAGVTAATAIWLVDRRR